MKPEVACNPTPALARLVMRRALWVGLAACTVVLVLGLLRAADDIDQEVTAALNLSALGAGLATLATQDDARALSRLQQLGGAGSLRHVTLTVRDGEGRTLVAPRPAAQAGPVVRWLATLHRLVRPVPEPRTVSWPLARPQGAAWQVTLAASHESERTEAMENLAGALAVVAAGAAALLVAMALNVRAALRPLRGVLQAIDAMRAGDAAPLRALPAAPTHELQAITAALRMLADALADAEAQRRSLSHKVITLQEDERVRLARELHDELGQRLTALRADAAWLQRRIGGDEAAAGVVKGMSQQCERLQHDVRSMLAQLQPLGAAAATQSGDWALLRDLLDPLVAGWNATAGVPWRVQFDATCEAPAATVPRELMLAVYRISQEALTNAARHSAASRVRLQLALRRSVDGAWIDWQVEDDGRGIADAKAALQLGNGLAGLRERVWAMGSELHMGTVGGLPRPGLQLSARFALGAPETARG